MAYKIEVYPTMIVINDYDIGDCPTIENMFTLYDKITHAGYFKYAIYDSENRRFVIPRGVDVGYIEHLLHVKAFYSSSHDPMIENTERIMLKNLPRDKEQIEAIKFLIGKGEYKDNINSSQLLVSLGTGMGKTYLSIAYIAFMNLKTIIITASVNWLKQWNDAFLKHSNINPDEIYFIRGSASTNTIMNRDMSKYKVFLVSHSTASKFISTNGSKAFRDLLIHLGIGIKIFDESHVYSDSLCYIDYCTNTYKTIYLTATPSRGDDYDNRIFQRYFKNVPRIMMKNKPHTRYLAIHYYSNMDAYEIHRCINKHGFDKNTYSCMLVRKKNFDYISRVIMDKISTIHGKILLFFPCNQAIQYFYDWIRVNYPEYYYHTGIFSSINPTPRNALVNKLILTTSKSAGAAMDIPNLSCSINMAEPIKSDPQVEQRFGRTRGDNTLFIDLIDNSVGTVTRYHERNMQIYEQLALEISSEVYDSSDLETQAFDIMLDREENGINPFILV